MVKSAFFVSVVALVAAGSPAAAQDLGAPGCPGYGFKSVATDQQVTMTVRNQSPEPVDVYWADFNGSLQFYQTVIPGGSYDQQTYAAHSWVFWQDNRCAFYLTMPTVSQTVDIR